MATRANTVTRDNILQIKHRRHRDNFNNTTAADRWLRPGEIFHDVVLIKVEIYAFSINTAQSYGNMSDGIEPTEIIIDAEDTHNAPSNEPEAGASHSTLKYHLLGPSLTKAGQDKVDQQKVRPPS